MLAGRMGPGAAGVKSWLQKWAGKYAKLCGWVETSIKDLASGASRGAREGEGRFTPKATG